MARKTLVSVSMAALMARINRKLARDGEHLKATRSERDRPELGDYYIVDINRNTVVAKHRYPEELAREIGVLKPYEALREA